MSSFVRRMQKRRPGLGSRLVGYTNPDAKDLIARLAREEKRNAKSLHDEAAVVGVAHT